MHGELTGLDTRCFRLRRGFGGQEMLDPSSVAELLRREDARRRRISSHENRVSGIENRVSGFTLTEVVVASTLLIIAMVPILRALTTAIIAEGQRCCGIAASIPTPGVEKED